MKYIKTYEKKDEEITWLVNVDEYFEESLKKIGMDEKEARRWEFNFTHGVAKPRTNKILVSYRYKYGSFAWDHVPECFKGEVKLTPEEKEQYDLEKKSNKYNL